MAKINTGMKVKDVITGFEGIVTCRSEWINGCIRVTVQPQKMKDGKPIDAQCFDEEQLEVVNASKIKLPQQTEPKKTGGPRPSPTRNRSE